MSYEVKLQPRAVKNYKTFDEHIKSKIRQKLETIKDDPHQYSFLSGQFSKIRKIKISTSGDRVVFTVREDLKRVIVLMIDTRENFYKELRKYLS